METKFNFKSSVCTSREQSERLLALGLKKETADMCYQIAYLDCGLLKECSPSLIPHNIIDDDRFIPAWSLHRLIEMALKDLLICGISFVFNDYSYDKVIELIEFQIKCARFPKEYLV